MTKKEWKHRGWKKKERDWRPYKPTAYDLERDPSLAKEKPPFDWKNLREFKNKEGKQASPEDALYRSFGRTTIDQKIKEKGTALKVVESDEGRWHVVNDSGTILANESSNSAAWRAVERLEIRAAGRKKKLYQSDNATTVK